MGGGQVSHSSSHGGDTTLVRVYVVATPGYQKDVYFWVIADYLVYVGMRAVHGIGPVVWCVVCVHKMRYVRLPVSTVYGGGVYRKGIRSGGGGDIGSKKPAGV